jgi:hypothetical protein
LKELHSIHARHFDIKYGKVNWNLSDTPESLLTVGIGVHTKPFCLKCN